MINSNEQSKTHSNYAVHVLSSTPIFHTVIENLIKTLKSRDGKLIKNIGYQTSLQYEKSNF